MLPIEDRQEILIAARRLRDHLRANCPDTALRNFEIMRRIVRGETKASIAIRFGKNRERVAQIERCCRWRVAVLMGWPRPKRPY